jgi:hypothetical protein
MICAHCQKPIDPKSAWKGISHDFFCSEFCADAETIEFSPARNSPLKDQIDHQYLERLKRLLPYMRRSTHPTQSVS